jgi:hypothetical protein
VKLSEVMGSDVVIGVPRVTPYYLLLPAYFLLLTDWKAE